MTARDRAAAAAEKVAALIENTDAHIAMTTVNDYDRGWRQAHRKFARDLAHLADALVAEGLIGDGETRVEWGARWPLEVDGPVSEKRARYWATVTPDVALVSRTVTVGAWEVADQ